MVLQHFRQGWGGAPESARLTARELVRFGVVTDVVDRGLLFRNVERMEALPEDSGSTSFTIDPRSYRAILHIGPWQPPRYIWPIWRNRGNTPYYYLPRGGLAKIEFEGRRNYKKIPYSLLFERRLLTSASGVIFSSLTERDNCHWTARRQTKGWVIPDYFSATDMCDAPTRSVTPDLLRIGFLAEISCRKGLLPMTGAVCDFALEHPERRIEFVIGGGTRSGQEAYVNAVRDMLGNRPQNLAVKWIGRVSHLERAEFYRSVDIFTAPSLFESFGLTTLEALQFGCSALCTRQMGVCEYVHDLPQLAVVQQATRDALRVGLETLSRNTNVTERHCISLAERLSRMNDLADRSWLQILGGRVALGSRERSADVATR